MMEGRVIQVLLVESNEKDAEAVIGILRAARTIKFQLRRTRWFRDALSVLRLGGTDVILLGLSLPGADLLDVVQRAQCVAPGVPVLVLSDTPDDAAAVKAFGEGAQDFLVKGELNEPYLMRALTHAVARQRLQMSLRNLSLRDELTGLHNRRGFITLAEQQLKVTARRGIRSSLIFADMDGLKQVNDTFGHREGDCALQALARVFLDCFRDSDIVARLGGDEFCVLLTDASGAAEGLVRERLLPALLAHNIRPGSLYPLSISTGIVETDRSSGIEQQLARADAAMYEQKRSKQIQIERVWRGSDTRRQPDASSLQTRRESIPYRKIGYPKIAR